MLVYISFSAGRRRAPRSFLRLIDNNGNTVVEYYYDAWGNHKVVDEKGDEITDLDNIGNLNPFRYRGYYYDTETGLYFLQTRYYDPEVGRFLNRDSVQYADPETINGLNLYAYCLNNPVEYVDPTGHFPFFILTALIGTAIGFGITTLVDYCDDGQVFNGSVHWGWYIGGALIGAVVGAGIGMLISYYATGSVTSSVSNVINGLFGKTTLYRTMSNADYNELVSTGKLPAGTETFVSPNASYASSYDGITVKFSIKNRTLNWLKKIGVRDTSALVSNMYPSMPIVSKGWMATNAFFKAEGTIINIGLGYGKALSIFNKGIILFSLL